MTKVYVTGVLLIHNCTIFRSTILQRDTVTSCNKYIPDICNNVNQITAIYRYLEMSALYF